MAEVEYRRTDYPDDRIVYTTRDSGAWAGAIILFVLLLFVFGLLFFMNYNSVLNWTHDYIDVPQQTAPPAPQQQIIPVPMPMPTAAPSSPAPTVIQGPPGPPGPPGPAGTSNNAPAGTAGTAGSGTTGGTTGTAGSGTSSGTAGTAGTGTNNAPATP